MNNFYQVLPLITSIVCALVGLKCALFDHKEPGTSRTCFVVFSIALISMQLHIELTDPSFFSNAVIRIVTGMIDTVIILGCLALMYLATKVAVDLDDISTDSVPNIAKDLMIKFGAFGAVVVTMTTYVFGTTIGVWALV
jgi:hypothetical protein